MPPVHAMRPTRLPSRVPPSLPRRNHLHYSLNLPAPASSRDLPPSWATKAGIWLCPTKVPSSTTPANLHLSTLPHPCGSVRLFVSLPRRLVDAYRKKGAEALASAIMEGSPELPANWAKEIAGAIFAAKGRAPEIEGATTRGTSYHGAREVLVGDAAHSLVPSLWLSGSATALGVLALVATLQGAGDDVEVRGKSCRCRKCEACLDCGCCFRHYKRLSLMRVVRTRTPLPFTAERLSHFGGHHHIHLAVACFMHFGAHHHIRPPY